MRDIFKFLKKFFWFLNICMVQAWRLYRCHMKERLRLLQLQQEVDNRSWKERMEERGFDKSAIIKTMKEREQQQKTSRHEEKKKEEIPLLEFTRQVVELTMKEHGRYGEKVVRSRSHSRSAQAAVRFDNGRHLIILTTNPVITGVYQACKKRTQYRCERCDVALHPQCFFEYHEPAK